MTSIWLGYFIVYIGLFPDVESNMIGENVAGYNFAAGRKNLSDRKSRIAGVCADLDASLGADRLQNQLKMLNHVQGTKHVGALCN